MEPPDRGAGRAVVAEPSPQPPTWLEFMREIDAQWQRYMREHDAPEQRLATKVDRRFTFNP